MGGRWRRDEGREKAVRDGGVAERRWELRELVPWPAVDYGAAVDPGDGGYVRLARPATELRLGRSSAAVALEHWLSGVG